MFGLFDRRGAERRSGGERRAAKSGFNGSDQRAGDRRAGERRKWPYGVIFKTTDPANDIEDWLDQNMSGDWYLALDDLDAKLQKKSFKVMFELSDDKAKFIQQFAKKRSAA